jgi:aldehyde dehydrogenase (NAD+)
MSLPPLVPEKRLLIDGRLVSAASGREFPNVDPATEEVLGSCADATREDVLAAVAAARRAFDESAWSRDAALRARCLRQLAAALSEERELLRAVVVHEAGAPVSSTPMMHVDYPLSGLPYWADLAERYETERPMTDISFMGQPQRRLLRREPVGVVGAITPWNVPLYLNVCKLGPALAAGCTVVLKPAPDTPWSATHVGRIVAERTEIPPGVVNVVPCADHRLGEILAGDPRIDAVTFTGSTATGRRVMELASATVKRVFLELGGKSAFIVLDDAKLERALAGIATVCIHGGQGCAITTRLLLPRARYEEGVEIARESFARWPYGDPKDPKHLQGPQISARQRDRVLGYIEKGREQGARVVAGGGRPAHLPRGFYVEPTLFADVDPRATIAQEEVFGPVLCAIPYDGDDEAVRIANDTIYGLSGAVFSGSEERALAVARRIRSGTLSVNGAQWFHVDTPFGGYRQSGIGRENGVMGFEEYLETKVVALPARQVGAEGAS